MTSPTRSPSVLGPSDTGVAGVSELARALAERTVAVRRDLHQHPEIAFEERRTMNVIARRLQELGLSPRTDVGGTGVVALWDSGRPGPTVLARADIDALPVAEENEVTYRSVIEGAMHACGHDGHTAVLLSVAEIVLARADLLCGRVLFLFQPAEEIVRGAAAMLEDGALDGVHVDHVIGLHLSSDQPTGTIAVREGPTMAATDSFRLVVTGRGGHAAKPQEVIDPVVAAAEVITTLQTLVSRETDPVDQSVVSITSVHGGTAFNIIPEAVELKGTLRTFRADTRERLRRRILEVAEGVATLHGASLANEWFEGSPAVVNDSVVTDWFRNVAADVVGADDVVTCDAMMGGDDMALWLQQAPGCYFFVGSNGGEASAYPHHHPRFDLDEAALPVAVSVLATAVERLLVDGPGAPG
ncbi:MAG: amidohydrolase [Trueperaceae bacterium]